MSLTRHSSGNDNSVEKYTGEREKPSRSKLAHSDFTRISENLIERDFFPQLAQLRRRSSETSTSAVPVKDTRGNTEEVIDLTSESLDSFKERFISAEESKIHQSVNRRKISDVAQNVFMFNHPGISSTSPLKRNRKGINYANTRLPLDWEDETEKSARADAVASARRRVFSTSREDPEDILQHGRR